MAPLSREEFARLFAGLDRARRLHFLEDLWSARGRETTVDGGNLRATNAETGETRMIRPVARSGDFDADVDVVVVARPSDRMRSRARAAGARYLEPADVRDLLLYALDRERADELTRRYFDRPLSVSTPERDDSTPDRRALVGALLVASVVLVAAAVGSPGLLPSTTGGGADAGAGTESTVTVTPVSVDTTPTPESTRTTTAQTRALGGTIDSEALARQHVAALEGRSYRWVARFRGSRDASGRQWMRGRQTMSVTGPRRYARNVTGERLTGQIQIRSVRMAEYADAESVYRRTAAPDGPTYRRFTFGENRTADRFTRRTAVYIERYLSTTRTTVREVSFHGYQSYRIVATGTPTALDPNQPGATGGVLHPPFGNVTNYRAVAYVEPTGIVFSLTVSYVVDDRQVSFAYEVGGIDSTRVTPPEWYGEARNATDEITGPSGK